MAELCIASNGLTYQFSRKETVLNDVGLTVNEGSIYGFLGPNGAGKTTTLKLILGLLTVQHGAITIFGQSIQHNRVPILRKIGSLIETPSLYSHLTAIENLRLLQVIYQCPKSRMNEVLNLVGLSQTGNKKVSQFSLGMKQRLSMAIALLHNPSLLILDEPTNGLDPHSIVEVRELLKHLNQQLGITILISSHLLAEIEKLVTHIGIINKGNLIFQGTLADLKSKQESLSTIVLATSNNENAVQILQTHGLTASIVNDKIVLPLIPKEEVAKVNHHLVQEGIGVYEIGPKEGDLEEIFMNIVNH